MRKTSLPIDKDLEWKPRPSGRPRHQPRLWPQRECPRRPLNFTRQCRSGAVALGAYVANAANADVHGRHALLDAQGLMAPDAAAPYEASPIAGTTGAFLNANGQHRAPHERLTRMWPTKVHCELFQ